MNKVKESNSGIGSKNCRFSSEDIQFVKDLARAAGRKAVDMRSGVEIREKTGPHDLVTAADCELSQMIQTALSERFPEDSIISEEDDGKIGGNLDERCWIIDPIDGTENYVLNDGQWCVMIGVTLNKQPMFGWLYVPSEDSVYWGGPHDGAWRTDAQGCERKLQLLPAVSAREVNENSLRIVVGSHDRRSHPEIMQRHDINWVLIGSSGMKVIGILNGKADVFVHFAKQMKIWDTAGPCAIAYGANLEAGTLDGRELVFDLPKTQHSTQVVVGRKGTIAWSGQVLAEFVDP